MDIVQVWPLAQFFLLAFAFSYSPRVGIVVHIAVFLLFISKKHGVSLLTPVSELVFIVLSGGTIYFTPNQP